jgi:hypothetical protein
VEGGDRLPWVRTAAIDNFAPLRSLDWQVQVYGETEETCATACRELSLPVHAFAWSEAAENAGLKRSAAYLIRPDGHVALACSEQSVAKLKAFVDRLGLRLPARTPAN